MNLAARSHKSMYSHSWSSPLRGKIQWTSAPVTLLENTFRMYPRNLRLSDWTVYDRLPHRRCYRLHSHQSHYLFPRSLWDWEALLASRVNSSRRSCAWPDRGSKLLARLNERLEHCLELLRRQLVGFHPEGAIVAKDWRLTLLAGGHSAIVQRLELWLRQIVRICVYFK